MTLTPEQRDELITVATTVITGYRRRRQAIATIRQELAVLREDRTPGNCNCRIDDFERWLQQQCEQAEQAEASTAEMWARADEACSHAQTTAT